MYTRFSSDTTDAVRWLTTLEYELPESFTPSQYLECINGLLSGDAALWADAHPRVNTILEIVNRKNATIVDARIFETALCARFPPKKLRSEYSSLSQYRAKAFGQHAVEDLEAYYQGVLAFMYSEGGVDRDEAPLTPREERGLEGAIAWYIIGLGDDDVSHGLQQFFELNRGLSLRAIHEKAKEQHGAKETLRGNKQTRSSVFGPRPNIGFESMPGNTGSLLPNNSTFPGPPPPHGTGHPGSRSGAGGPDGTNFTNDAPPARTTDSPFSDFPRGHDVANDIETPDAAEAGAADSSNNEFEQWKDNLRSERPRRPFRDTTTTRGVYLVNSPPTAPQDRFTSQLRNSHHRGPPPQHPPPHSAYNAPNKAAKPLFQSKPATELSDRKRVPRFFAEQAARRANTLANQGVAAQNRLREQPNPVLTPRTYENIHARAGERPFFGNGSTTGAGHNVGGPRQFHLPSVGFPHDTPLPNNQWLRNRGNASTDAGGPGPRPPAGPPHGFVPPQIRHRKTKANSRSADGSRTNLSISGNTHARRASNLAGIGHLSGTAVDADDTDTVSSSGASTLVSEVPSTGTTPARSLFRDDLPGIRAV